MAISIANPPAFRLANEADEVFLKHLFSETNEALHWMPPAMRETLWNMQYQARALNYAAMYPQTEDRILFFNGRPVGRHLLHRGRRESRTVDIAVLPEYQRKGIGSASLEQVLQEAAGIRQPHFLSVAKGNPAVELYRRLGFVVYEADEIYLQMRWSAE